MSAEPVTCANCGARVVLGADGSCPACSEGANAMPPADVVNPYRSRGSDSLKGTPTAPLLPFVVVNVAAMLFLAVSVAVRLEEGGFRVNWTVFHFFSYKLLTGGTSLLFDTVIMGHTIALISALAFWRLYGSLARWAIIVLATAGFLSYGHEYVKFLLDPGKTCILDLRIVVLVLLLVSVLRARKRVRAAAGSGL